MSSAKKIHFDRVFGDTVRRMRHERNISQRELANDSTLSHASIVAIEDGRGCSFHVAALIAEGLDCTLDDLAVIDAMMEPTS